VRTSISGAVRALRAAVIALLLGCPALLSAQEGGTPWFTAGVRAGVGGGLVAPAEFDAAVQEIFPREKSYFPVYSRVGLAAGQRLLTGPAGRVTLEEWMLVSGLDQNIALPAGSLLLSYRAPFGLTVGLGPELSMVSRDGTLGVAPALIYVAGWTFSLGRVSLPVLLIADPLPFERWIRLSLMAGLDFGLTLKLPGRRPPFNY
jgi:hypothetical protein